MNTNAPSSSDPKKDINEIVKNYSTKNRWYRLPVLILGYKDGVLALSEDSLCFKDGEGIIFSLQLKDIDKVVITSSMMTIKSLGKSYRISRSEKFIASNLADEAAASSLIGQGRMKSATTGGLWGLAFERRGVKVDVQRLQGFTLKSVIFISLATVVLSIVLILIFS